MALCDDGYSDVRMVATDGRVHEACEYACAKRVPSAASASIAGVRIASYPYHDK